MAKKRRKIILQKRNFIQILFRLMERECGGKKSFFHKENVEGKNHKQKIK